MHYSKPQVYLYNTKILGVKGKRNEDVTVAATVTPSRVL